MSTTAPARRRVTIGATIDPKLLEAVDDYVTRHPDYDRGRVLDEALTLWHKHEQERALHEQFEAPDDADPRERAAWRQIRRAAAERWLARSDGSAAREAQ